MKGLKLQKKPLGKMFIIQYGHIIGFEVGLIICSNYVDFNFLVFQLLIIPVFFVLIISKYNKSVTKIEIDYDNKFLRLQKNYFLILTKSFEIPFDRLSFQQRMKWLLNFYTQVLEIKESGKLLVVIPLNGSIWNKDEIDLILHSLKDLAEKGEIKADLV
jgi:predicted membrane metal-binding protein